MANVLYYHTYQRDVLTSPLFLQLKQRYGDFISSKLADFFLHHNIDINSIILFTINIIENIRDEKMTSQRCLQLCKDLLPVVLQLCRDKGFINPDQCINYLNYINENIPYVENVISLLCEVAKNPQIAQLRKSCKTKLSNFFGGLSCAN